MKHTIKKKFSCALATLTMIIGCASLEVARDVQAGRNALQTDQPETAVAYLARASAQDPAYKTPYRLGQNVLTYLGRAYYETGRNKEARAALEQALSRDSGDSLARLYLGLVLLRGGERERGGREIQTGLKTLHEDIDNLAADNIWGSYWDPARQIRGDIKKPRRSATTLRSSWHWFNASGNPPTKNPTGCGAKNHARFTAAAATIERRRDDAAVRLALVIGMSKIFGDGAKNALHQSAIDGLRIIPSNP